jgi:hypothetical protein
MVSVGMASRDSEPRFFDFAGSTGFHSQLLSDYAR